MTDAEKQTIFNAACRAIARNPKAVASQLPETVIVKLANLQSAYEQARSEFERAKQEVTHEVEYEMSFKR